MMPFAELVHESATAAWLFIPSAILLGALHGLEPGHSKTMMAAFIIAVRGTVRQATLLAISATISHTAIVWVVAILALTYGSQWSAEATEPYFQLVSAAVIVGIALWMLLRTFREQRAISAASRLHAGGRAHAGMVIDTGHGLVELSIVEDAGSARFRLYFMDRVGHSIRPPADHTISVDTIRPDGAYRRYALGNQGEYFESVDSVAGPHEFVANLELQHDDHGHTYPTRFGTVEQGSEVDRQHLGDRHGSAGAAGGKLDLGDLQGMDAHQRSHAMDIQRRFAGRTVTTGQVVLFGLTGGLLPCPAAVTVLLLCLQLQRFWLGIVLVLFFSVGLALTLLASGTVAAWGMREASKRWSGFDALAMKLPYASSALIILVGIYIGWSGWVQLAVGSA
ncbi:MAG: sulfite exporter TauE/SafE family protein [Proteobacteria bacterium]|nr:sulfite exporter TauE/SafE family protein [Pseudomonadota bacterium]